MISPERALALILDEAGPLPAEEAPLEDCLGRVLAEDAAARGDLPPFDNSAMDGYAVRARDCAAAREGAPVALSVRAVRAAGEGGAPLLRPGEAFKIMTGAPLPRGADAVVMKERAQADDGRVLICRPPSPGDHVRERGEDARRGERLIAGGTKLRAFELALLASQGLRKARVLRRPRVAVLSTGDELAAAGVRLAPGKIYDANGPALCAAVERWGAVPLPQGAVKDERGALTRALSRALEAADVLIVTGGVSVGDFDYTQERLVALGMKVVFWKTAIKPGKPLLFGTVGRKLVFGLPGNPVAALVCLEEFVRPALERLSGRAAGFESYHLEGRALNGYPAKADRRQYLFCKARKQDGAWALEILRPQGSARLSTACAADALAVAPEGKGRVKPGDALRFRWLK